MARKIIASAMRDVHNIIRQAGKIRDAAGRRGKCERENRLPQNLVLPPKTFRIHVI